MGFRPASGARRSPPPGLPQGRGIARRTRFAASRRSVSVRYSHAHALPPRTSAPSALPALRGRRRPLGPDRRRGGLRRARDVDSDRASRAPPSDRRRAGCGSRSTPRAGDQRGTHASAMQFQRRARTRALGAAPGSAPGRATTQPPPPYGVGGRPLRRRVLTARARWFSACRPSLAAGSAPAHVNSA